MTRIIETKRSRMRNRRSEVATVQRGCGGGGVGVGDGRSVRRLGVKVKGQGLCHWDTPKGQGVEMILSLLTGVRVVKSPQLCEIDKR